jgi:aspartyl-tRNA(Asn)/glutamyl-tRNA(Gln) amidotransferase subunit A
VTEALPMSACLFTTEAYAEWHEVIEVSPDLMFDEILARFRAGAEFSGTQFVGDWQRLLALRQSFHAKTVGYDAVIIPSAPILPPNTARLLSDHDYFVRANLLALRNTRIGNLMGSAALTLPTGVPSCGLMLLGQPFSERALLRVGAAVEAALGAKDK